MSSLTDESSDNEKRFWDKIHNMDEISVDVGLDVSGNRYDVYKNIIEMFLREYDKRVENLNMYLADEDMESLRTEVHGIKGALALLGAMKLKTKAQHLENAARESDMAFYTMNFPEFISDLTAFGTELKAAYTELRCNRPTFTIPPELPPILNRITELIAGDDIVAIYDQVDLLDTLDLTGFLKEEVDRLKSAVLIMNYEYSLEIIDCLLINDTND